MIPWVAIGLIGTATAFLVGFKNTQTYNRLWEARQIWGSIINTSRAWGILAKDTVKSDKTEIQTLIYRHLAWLTALRYQMREPRLWENAQLKSNVEFSHYFKVPEKETPLEVELKKFLSDEELTYILSKKNRATHIISLQSKHLSLLKASGKLSEFDFIELERTLTVLYEHQGKSERIKNFPYPRHYATLNLYFIMIFVILVPFGMLQEFEKLGECMIWLSVPFSVLSGWIFTTMEKIGETSESPFEGSPNDVPITQISRNIEIDMLEILNINHELKPIKPHNNIVL